MFSWSILDKKNSRNRTDRKRTKILSQQFEFYFEKKITEVQSYRRNIEEIWTKRINTLMFNTYVIETAI